MSTTRLTLRQRIGTVFLHDTTLSTPTSGSTSTLVDTTLTASDSTYMNAELVVTHAAANSTVDYRVVTGWTQSTGTFTPNRNFSQAVANTAAYELHQRWWGSDVNAQINEAIRLSGDRWARNIEDTSLSLIANTYTYALAGLTVPVDRDWGLQKIEYDTKISSTGFPYAVIDNDNYELRDNDGVLTLQLKWYPPLTSTTMRLTYQVRPPVLNDDTTALLPDVVGFQEYICAKATALLFDEYALTQEDVKYWQVKAIQMHQLAETYYDADRPLQKPTKTRMPVIRSVTTKTRDVSSYVPPGRIRTNDTSY